MDDPSLDDDGRLEGRLVLEEAEIVERFNRQGETRFHEHAAQTELANLGRLDDQHLAVQSTEQVDAFRGSAF